MAGPGAKSQSQVYPTARLMLFPIPHNVSSETLKGKEQTDGKAITEANLGLKGRTKCKHSVSMSGLGEEGLLPTCLWGC